MSARPLEGNGARPGRLEAQVQDSFGRADAVMPVESEIARNGYIDLTQFRGSGSCGHLIHH